MYLRFARRRKDGKEHRYWSIVESRRCAGGRVVQRPILYLGEINDGQREAFVLTVEGPRTAHSESVGAISRWALGSNARRDHRTAPRPESDRSFGQFPLYCGASGGTCSSRCFCLA